MKFFALFVVFFTSMVVQVFAQESGAYEAFIQKNQAYALPITEEMLNEQVELARIMLVRESKNYSLNLTNDSNTPIYIPSNLTTPELREALIPRLNIQFLLNKLKEPQYRVTIVSTTSFQGYTEQEMILNDPEIGNLSVLIVIPHANDDGPRPSIVFFHGHGSTVQDVKTRFYAEDLARAGYVVFIPYFRSMKCDEEENRISKKLLLNGFTLEGIHVYEALLVLDVVKKSPDVDAAHIGALAHSGGSSLLHLVLRFSNDIKSVIHDYRANYLNFCGPGGIHDETIPRLKKYTPAINNDATLHVTLKEVSYDYIRGKNRVDKTEIIDFFDRTLKKKESLMVFFWNYVKNSIYALMSRIRLF